MNTRKISLPLAVRYNGHIYRNIESTTSSISPETLRLARAAARAELNSALLVTGVSGTGPDLLQALDTSLSNLSPDQLANLDPSNISVAVDSIMGVASGLDSAAILKGLATGSMTWLLSYFVSMAVADVIKTERNFRSFAKEMKDVDPSTIEIVDAPTYDEYETAAAEELSANEDYRKGFNRVLNTLVRAYYSLANIGGSKMGDWAEQQGDALEELYDEYSAAEGLIDTDPRGAIKQLMDMMDKFYTEDYPKLTPRVPSRLRYFFFHKLGMAPRLAMANHFISKWTKVLDRLGATYRLLLITEQKMEKQSEGQGAPAVAPA